MTAKIDLTTTLGTFCTAHPNICLFASDGLSRDHAKAFYENEFQDICTEWCQTVTHQTIADFADAYWIACCIVKRIGEFAKKGSMPSDIFVTKFSYAYMLVKEVPCISLNGTVGSPFWLKIETIIKRIKSTHAEEIGLLPGQSQTLINFAEYDDTQFVKEHPRIVDVAKGNITADDEPYDDACDEMVTDLEEWANLVYRDTPTGKYLMTSKDRRTDEVRTAAIDDLCRTYWLLKAWKRSIDSFDETKSGKIDDIVKESVKVADAALCHLENINVSLTTTMSLIRFCEERDKLCNSLRQQFKFAASVDNLYDDILALTTGVGQAVLSEDVNV